MKMLRILFLFALSFVLMAVASAAAQLPVDGGPVLVLRGLYKVSDSSLVFADANKIEPKYGLYGLRAGEQYMLVADVVSHGGGLKKLVKRTVWTYDVETERDIREFDLNNPQFEFVYGLWRYSNPLYSPHSAVLIYFELWVVDIDGHESNHVIVGPAAVWD